MKTILSKFNEYIKDHKSGINFFTWVIPFSFVQAVLLALCKISWGTGMLALVCLYWSYFSLINWFDKD